MQVDEFSTLNQSTALLPLRTCLTIDQAQILAFKAASDLVPAVFSDLVPVLTYQMTGGSHCWHFGLT